MKKLLTLLLLFSSLSYGSEIKNKISLDLGVLAAPTFVPEVGYEGVKTRLGVELGICFFDYTDTSVVEIKGVNESTTPFRLLRIGIASIERDVILTVSPISVMIRDRAYLTSSFGLGKKPYTIFSFSYVLIKE